MDGCPKSTGAVYLVSCVGPKLEDSAPARDLNVSPWFRKARSYVERRGAPWFILSAKYGAVHPDTVIPPYDMSLNTMSVEYRRQWSKRVLAQLEPHLAGVDTVVVLAGQRYREYLLPGWERRGLRVCVPMKGLRIGEQLRWLTCALDRLCREDGRISG